MAPARAPKQAEVPDGWRRCGRRTHRAGRIRHLSYQLLPRRRTAARFARAARYHHYMTRRRRPNSQARRPQTAATATTAGDRPPHARPRTSAASNCYDQCRHGRSKRATLQRLATRRLRRVSTATGRSTIHRIGSSAIGSPKISPASAPPRRSRRTQTSRGLGDD